jgi:hypothetical protein
MKRYAYILFLLSCTFTVAGQETIEAIVNKTTVGVNEAFNFQLNANAKCPITTPDFGDLIVLGPPAQGSSRGINIINGKQTISVKYSYTYTLKAPAEGKYTIPSVTMECDGKKIKTKSITITASDDLKQQEVNKDFFMRLTSNKSTVYEGEPFVLTLKYYAKASPENIEAFEVGKVSGVWRENLNPKQTNFNTGIETVNGIRYYAIVLREELCFAQRSGTVEIEPYYTSIIFAENFFNRFRKETYSNSLKINVKQVPEEGAVNYTGLVGSFKMNSEISKISAKMGEAIDLKITLSGKGNLQVMGNLGLEFPKDFEVYDPEIDERTSNGRGGVSGQITYNYVFIPTHYGEFTIPAFELSYFDLESKEMKTISSEEFKIQVEKPDGVSDISFSPTNPIEVEDKTIRYIHSEMDNVFTMDRVFFGKISYYTLLSSPFVLSLFFILIRRKKENLSPEERLKIAQKGIIKPVLKEIAEAKELATSNESAALKKLQSALTLFFKTKFDLGLSDLSQFEINQQLGARNVENDALLTFNAIWRAIELGQYAPIAQENLQQTIQDTEQLVQELDKTI